MESVLAFSAVALGVSITPGVDTVFVLRSSASGGIKGGGFSAAGILAGCSVWGLFCSAGLGALLSMTPIGWDLLRWAGALYLGYLGLKLILEPRVSLPDSEAAAISGEESFAQGLLINLANPKIPLFYLAVLPQFVPQGAPPLLFPLMLAAVHISLSALWFAAIIIAATPLKRFWRNPRAIKAVDRIAGIVFVALAGKLAISALAQLH